MTGWVGMTGWVSLGFGRCDLGCGAGFVGSRLRGNDGRGRFVWGRGAGWGCFWSGEGQVGGGVKSFGGVS